MNKRLIIAFTLLLSLSGCYPGCDDFEQDPYKHVVSASTIQVYNAPQKPNTSTPIELRTTAEANDFMIEVKTIPTNSNASETNFISYFVPKISIHLFNSAHACSPPTSIISQKLAILNITSDSDFSEQYPAGSNLNKLFKIEFFEGEDLSGLDIEDITEESTIDYDSGHTLQHLQLKLTQAPSLSKSHRFFVQVNYADIFTLQTVTFK